MLTDSGDDKKFSDFINSTVPVGLYIWSLVVDGLVNVCTVLSNIDEFRIFIDMILLAAFLTAKI